MRLFKKKNGRESCCHYRQIIGNDTWAIELQRQCRWLRVIFKVITGPPTHSVGASIVTVAAVCLSSSSVVVSRLWSVALPAGGPAGRRARGRWGGKHCTAGQYGCVPLGRHLVQLVIFIHRILHGRNKENTTNIYIYIHKKYMEKHAYNDHNCCKPLQM